MISHYYGLASLEHQLFYYKELTLFNHFGDQNSGHLVPTC